ncbi:hypothetical protein TWF718_001752 [Orbilia javanica]|uniref:G domain-containing protein n=1 Tax=Orbilia javanica TaxID=47235 RepID=A0AAN8N1A4_9PEZI
MSTFTENATPELEDAPGESIFPPEDFRDGLAPHDSDVFLLLLGQSGAGKTTFISHCTDNKDLFKDGDPWRCFSRPYKPEEKKGDGTEEVKIYRCELELHPPRNVYLIDTPGFGHKTRKDAEALHEIADFLARAHGLIHIHGVLYFQAIVEDGLIIKRRTLGYMDLAVDICGEKVMKDHATLVVTKWEDPPVPEGCERQLIQYEESEGRLRYWREAISKAANCYFRLVKDSRESAMELLKQFQSSQPMVPLGPLQLQEELAGEHSSLCETAAGQRLQMHLELKIHRAASDIKGLQGLVPENPEKPLPSEDFGPAAVLDSLVSVIRENQTKIGECMSELRILKSSFECQFSKTLREEVRQREVDTQTGQRIIDGLYDRIVRLAKEAARQGSLSEPNPGMIQDYLLRKLDLKSASFNTCDRPISIHDFRSKKCEWETLIATRASKARHSQSKYLQYPLLELLPSTLGRDPLEVFSKDSNANASQYRMLYNLTQTGIAPMLKTSLEKTPNVEMFLTSRDDRGFTPLHIAVERGSLEMTEALLAKMTEQDMYIQDNYGYTPLALAVLKERWALVNAIAPSFSNPAGFTVANMFAFKEILSSPPSVLKPFLELSESDPKFWKLRTEDDSTILHVAMGLDRPCANICFDTIYSAPTNELHELLNYTNRYGLTAIAQAALNGRLTNILEFAQRFGNRVRMREVINKGSRLGTPFFLAATRGHLECAQALLSLGANPDRLEFCGLTTDNWIKSCTGVVTELRKNDESTMTAALESQAKLWVTVVFDSLGSYAQTVSLRSRQYLLSKNYEDLLSDPVLLYQLSQHYFNLAERIYLIKAAGRLKERKELLLVPHVETGITLYALYIYALRERFGFLLSRCDRLPGF